MTTFELDASGPLKSLDAMQEQIHQFPQEMAAELTRWQSEDMNRRYPNTTLEDNTAYTDIWPRSVKPKQQKKQRRRWPPRRHVQTHPIDKVRSTRPILRESLYGMLVDRMDNLMSSCLAWRP